MTSQLNDLAGKRVLSTGGSSGGLVSTRAILARLEDLVGRCS